MQFTEYYVEYVPQSVRTRVPHAYDEYLQKLAASRKRGRTEKRYLPLYQRYQTTSLLKEIDLKDHVIQELNSRVFKLESIIQVIY